MSLRKVLGWRSRLTRKVFIDPGHGGLDDGAIAEPGKMLFEDEVNLTMGLFLDLMLRNQGVKTLMSRNRDIAVSLADRCAAANAWAADIFVSIHVNSFVKPGPQGFGVYVYGGTTNPNTQTLAEMISSNLADDFPDHVQRGIYAENFYVLRKTAMPAVLVECEFISNPAQAEWMRKIENRYLMAISISRGIQEFFGSLGGRSWRK